MLTLMPRFRSVYYLQNINLATSYYETDIKMLPISMYIVYTVLWYSYWGSRIWFSKHRILDIIFFAYRTRMHMFGVCIYNTPNIHIILLCLICCTYLDVYLCVFCTAPLIETSIMRLVYSKYIRWRNTKNSKGRRTVLYLCTTLSTWISANIENYCVESF